MQALNRVWVPHRHRRCAACAPLRLQSTSLVTIARERRLLRCGGFPLLRAFWASDGAATIGMVVFVFVFVIILVEGEGFGDGRRWRCRCQRAAQRRLAHESIGGDTATEGPPHLLVARNERTRKEGADVRWIHERWRHSRLNRGLPGAQEAWKLRPTMRELLEQETSTLKQSLGGLTACVTRYFIQNAEQPSTPSRQEAAGEVFLSFPGRDKGWMRQHARGRVAKVTRS